MEKYIKTSRIVSLALIFALLLSVYGLTLYRIQAIDSEAILSDTSNLTASTVTVYAARGSILDRYGVLLVSDRTVYDVRIDRNRLLKTDDPNGIILKLINACRQYGVEYNDIFPVTTTAPFEYRADATSTQKSWMRAYFTYFKSSLNVKDTENPDVSATQLISWMREHYGIDYTVAAEDARRIMGVRYGLEMQAVNNSEYMFANDIPAEFLTFVSEQNLPAVSILSHSEREYHTEYAAHLLGYLGAMDKDEVEKYEALGYPRNATVGKTGVEAAFEEYLHGTDGSVTVYTDETGAVNDVVENKPAKAGSNVYLTISLSLQKAAEDALRNAISQMNDTRVEQAQEKAREENTTYVEPELAEGGAVVVMDVRTGEVLALANYPSFNLATFYEDYSVNASNPLHPFNNRALNGLYEPGSTYKPVTAFAALRSHTIAPDTTILDESVFREYAEQGYSPHCWIYPGSHGSINVVQALEKSCNYFFWSVADKMGITRIAETARLFGLGSPTGIELGDSSGTVASRESKQEQQNEGWWAADTLLACIGQSINRFTPIQLANYAATIANGGTHYNATVLRSVSSFDYTNVFIRRTPSVESVIDDSEGYIPLLQQGMRAVAKTGTAAQALSNYQVPVAAKTGTVQQDNSAVNDGVFICYAPADDPEIAIAVVVEKGGSGSALISIAKDVMDTYFAGTSQSVSTVSPDNSLLK